MISHNMDLKLSTHRKALDAQGVVHDSTQPFGVDMVQANKEGVRFRLVQDRGVEVTGEFGLAELSEVLKGFANRNPDAAQALAFEMLGEIGRIRRSRIEAELSKKGAD